MYQSLPSLILANIVEALQDPDSIEQILTSCWVVTNMPDKSHGTLVKVGNPGTLAPVTEAKFTHGVFLSRGHLAVAGNEAAAHPVPAV
jgi:hypothetical protein